MKIGLCDLEFAHITSPTRYHDDAIPELMQWDRDKPESNKVVIFTERCYDQATERRFENNIRIAWALESPAIHGYSITDLKAGKHKNFHYIITVSRDFMSWIEQNTEAKPIWYSPFGGWIRKEDHKIYQKTKNIQMIASKKDWCEGHRLRFEVANKLGNRVDKYGKAFKEFGYTLDVFKDYRYAIVIENIMMPDYFSDKLTSCFYTGTVPIMWNNGFISKYFDTDGMFLWKTIQELKNIVKYIENNPDDYESKKKYIQHNFEIAKEYFSPDDFIYTQLFRELYLNDKA